MHESVSASLSPRFWGKRMRERWKWRVRRCACGYLCTCVCMRVCMGVCASVSVWACVCVCVWLPERGSKGGRERVRERDRTRLKALDKQSCGLKNVGRLCIKLIFLASLKILVFPTNIWNRIYLLPAKNKIDEGRFCFFSLWGKLLSKFAGCAGFDSRVFTAKYF